MKRVGPEEHPETRGTRRKFQKLELEDVGYHCFGRVLHKGSKSYAVTLEIKPGSNLLVSNNQVFEGFALEAGDQVEVSYDVIAPATGGGGGEIFVKELYPEFESGVGRITGVEADAIFINNHIVLHADSLDNGAHLTDYPIDSLVDYRAIRNEGGQRWQYRCFSLQPVDQEREKTIKPDFQGTLDQYSCLGANKRGIAIDNRDVTFTFLDTALGTDEKQTRHVRLVNVTLKDQKLINLGIKRDDAEREDQFTILEPDFSQGPVLIRSHGSVDVIIEATCKQLGITHEYLIFYLEHNTTMLRNLRIVAGSRHFLQSYEYTLVVQPKPRPDHQRTFDNFNRRWAGPRWVTQSAIPPKPVTEREWAAPRNISEFLQVDEWTKPFAEHFEFMFAPLTPLNYTEQLHNMLWFDEIYLFRSFQDLNRRAVRLNKEPGDPCLYSVAGSFSEGRPSILPGDRFFCDHPKGLHFDGLVTEVQQDKAVLLMNSNFLPHAHLAYDTGFKFGRNGYKMQHEAIESMGEEGVLRNYVFPTRRGLVKQACTLNVELRETGQVEIVSPDGTEPPRPVTFIRPDLNVVQKRTICNVIRGEYRTHPYLIDGPPGTGKTATLVEIISLALHEVPDARILVCTQSNSAADLILAKLVESERVHRGDVLRVLARQYYRSEEGVRDDLRPYCSALFEADDANGPLIQATVGLATLLSTKILIMTASSVGSLRRLDFPTDHFTHLVVDEAGQCFEGEALIPIRFMEHERSQVVLAGDIKQLGPTTRWAYLEECGYGQSLFERLLKIPGLYAVPLEEGEALKPAVVPELYSMLNCNYRCIPSILNLFNGLFYQGQLRSTVRGRQMHSLVLRLLQTRLPRMPELASDQGVYFLSVVGENRKAFGSPSWHNEIEAETVLQLYKGFRGVGISASDVVVMTPYHGQVRYIRQLMAHRGLDKCHVGSVEEFQGQEKTIVILSTVRSTRSLVEFDQRYNLGFLANPRRTNVALSRAQVLLVIVGNAPVLNRDPLWRQVIDYCCNNYSYFDMQAQLMESLQ